MSDPYRTSGGQSCPRCRNVLARETDDWMKCTSGCGTWIGNGLLKTLLDPATLVKSNGNPFRAAPLPPTKCLVCKKPLNDLYKGAIDVLTLGQCVPHGVWLDRADRATFEAMYSTEIRLYRKVAEKQQQLELAPLDPEVASLIIRVETLEALVQKLQRELDELKSK